MKRKEYIKAIDTETTGIITGIITIKTVKKHLFKKNEEKIYIFRDRDFPKFDW